MEYKKSKFNYYFEYEGDNYIYNTYSSALAKLDDKDFNIEEPYIDDLLNNGYIVDESTNEVQNILNEINEYINKPRKELDITVILTEMCNFRCVYCYQTKNINIFSQEDADELISQAAELYDNGYDILNIHYFGGEPLLNLNVLEYLDKEFKKISKDKNKTYNSFVTTNGSLLTDDLIKNIDFNTYYLTFDGNEEWQNKLKISNINSYQNNFRIIRNILKLSNSNINIRFNVCKDNYVSFIDTINKIVKLKEYDSERIKYEITPLKKLTANANFKELKPEEYAKIHLELCLVLKNKGIKLYLPRAFSEPCKYITGNAYCIGPKMKACYCSSDNTLIQDKINILEYKKNITYNHEIPSECLDCNVMPLCIHSCGLLKDEGAACIPEKFILKDILCDYLQYPETWKE